MTAKTYNIYAVLGIAASWAKQHLPGWTDDSHRDLLARHGATEVEGRVSAKTLSAAGIEAALSDYEQRGWPRRRGNQDGASSTRRVVKPADKQVAMMQAIWLQLGQAGVLERPGKDGLLHFASKVTGKDVMRLEDLGMADRGNLINQLKAWQSRAAA